MNRIEGFYWVKFEGEWEIAWFGYWRDLNGNIKEGNWNRIGELIEEYPDSAFDEIDENQIIRKI